MRSLLASILLALSVTANAQLAHDLTCDFFVPDGQGGFEPGRCVPVATINPGANPTTGHVLTVQPNGGVAPAAGTGSANTISSATPQDVTTGAGAAGGTGDVSDAAHAHALSGAVQNRLLPASPGDNQIPQYDAATSSWEAVDPNTGTSLTISTSTPQDVVTGTGSPGSTGEVSDAGHVHGGDRVGQPGSGLQSVATDPTLTGDGTGTDPLAVANPFTAADESKLDGIADSATANEGDITSVGTTAPLTGGGVSGDVTVAIRAASPTQSGSMSASDKAKLDGVASNATANEGDITSVTVSAPLAGGGSSGDLAISLPDATTTASGAMSGADKTKLDGVAAGATANTGDITEVGATAPLTGGGTAGSVTLAISPASTTAAGSMSAADKVKLDGLEEQIQLIDSLNDVTYTQADTASLSSRFGGGATVYTADLDADGTGDAEINDLIVFQWRDNPAGVPSDRALGIRINDTGTTLPIRIVDPLTNSLTNKTRADLTRYEFLFLSRQDGVFIQLSTLELSGMVSRLLPGSPSDDQIARYDSGTSAWVAEDLAPGGVPVEANPTGAPDEVLDSLLVGTNRYSVIVRPGSNGRLRDPTAADYDATHARSKTLAVVDGEPYKAHRRLIGAHTAAGTFTRYADLSTIVVGGTTFRYRGIHYYDGGVSNPQVHDFYYNVHDHKWRSRRDGTRFLGSDFWDDVGEGSHLLTDFGWVGYYDSEELALAAATANGQRFAYPASGGIGYAVFTISGFTAAAAGHYVYDWRHAAASPVLPSNDTLVDDLEVTFNAADRPSIEVQFSRELLSADDGRPILFDYRPGASGGNNRAAGGVILAEHVRHLTTLRPLALQKNPPGGRNPIDHTEDLPTAGNRRSPGHVEFPFPLSTGDNDLRWMRLIYIGDHIDDMDGAFGAGATTITVNDPADIEAGKAYWIVGPISGGGCTPTYHSERVMVTAVGTPNADDLTVDRGLDGTDLPNNCQWVSGADIIEDDKRTFVLAATDDDQDSGDFTITLLSQGVGGQSAAADSEVATGGGILRAKYLESDSTETSVTDGGSHTVVSQAITIAAASDRVFVDAQIVVEGSGNASTCDVRINRGTTQLIDVDGSVAFGGLHHPVEAAVMDTPGSGTFTYSVSVHDEAAGTCTVNPDGVESFLVTEILAANP